MAYIDYRSAFECVEAVAQSMLGHAGDVEAFEDDDGWLCLRTKLMRRWSSKQQCDVVCEPIGCGTPHEDLDEHRTDDRPDREPEPGAFLAVAPG